ncbi:ferrochelatase [Arcanobacterium haemolyticum]
MKRGCLIVALGTPASPAVDDIKAFLRTFLSDPAVVDMPRWIWKPILNSIVLRFRPPKIASIYERVWTPEGSPLRVHTINQARHTQEQLDDVVVRWATTYTQPAISDVIAEMDVDELVVIPLYPQYTPSTVADIWRQLDEVERTPGAPRIIRAESWYDDLEYITWHAAEIRSAIDSAAQPYDKIIFSFHGVPNRPAHRPDQYHDQCEVTTNAIMDRVGNVPWEMTFQSKFGPGKWLQPATIGRMAQLPSEGTRRILVVTPGFFSSCIETIDEIDLLNKEAFLNAGGQHFLSITPPDSTDAAGRILASVYRSTKANTIN